MHRRPSITQRDGLFSTTRYILYGNRVRVIRQSPLARDDQYIPLTAVDPDSRVVRLPNLRLAAIAALLLVPAALALAGWPRPLRGGELTASLGLCLLGFVIVGTRAWPGRTYVQHGALQLISDQPDPTSFRHFESQIVSASREQLVSSAGAGAEGPISLAREIRRLHAHCADGQLSPEVFGRHKRRLISSIREFLR
jgi:hypothetical protein